MGISKIGLHINGFAAGDKNELFNQLKEWQPTTTLVMDDFEMAKYIAAISPNTKVVFRKYFDDGQDKHEGSEWRFKTPTQWVNETMQYGNPDIFRHVLNEPGWNNDFDLQNLITWLCQVAELLVERGYKGVLGNFSVGSWGERQINSGIFDPLIQICNKYKGKIYLGVHEYMGALLPAGAGTISIEDVKRGTNIQPDKWPKPSDLPTKKIWWSGAWVLPGYWQIRRSDWFVIRAWEILGYDDPAPIGVWVDEGGWDTLSNLANAPHYLYDHIKNHYGISGDYPGIRGHQTLRNYWNKVFPQWAGQPGRAEFEQLYWWSTILPDWVVGVNLFSRNFDRLWSGPGSAGTNYAETPEVINLIINKVKEERGQGTTPPSTIVPFPPIDALWKTAYIEPVAFPFKVRDQPNTTAVELDLISAKTYVFYQEGSKVQEGTKFWYPISYIHSDGIEIHGWSRSDVWKFSETTPNIPVVPQQLIMDVVNELDLSALSFKALADKLRAYVKKE